MDFKKVKVTYGEGGGDFHEKIAFHTHTNYHSSPNELGGCLNDWRNILRIIDDWFGIDDMDRQSFIEKNYNFNLVVSQAKNLPLLVRKNDLLIYSNSGHGTLIPDNDGDEVSGYDQALYTDDGKFISDDMIHRILSQFVPGCLIIGIFDNCHAGTMDRGLINWHRMPKDVVANAVTYLGCEEQGTSADATINNLRQGACTYYLLESLVEHQYHISYVDLLDDANKRLRLNGYRQVMQMACTEGMENLLFGKMPTAK